MNDLVNAIANLDEEKVLSQGDTTTEIYGIAFDIGTTSVAGYLVNMIDGKVLASTSATNGQRVHGVDDQINPARNLRSTRLEGVHNLTKQEDIIEEFKRARFNEEAVSVERVHFYKTDKGVNPKQEDPIRFFPGRLPVLVSAPHSVRHYRDKKIRMSDEFTGSIVYLLNKLTGCQAMAVSKFYGGDPNKDNPCIYKERVAEICQREKVKLVLDIHGVAREREFDVDLGTNQGKNLLSTDRILEILKHNFQIFGLSKISYDTFAASEPNIVTNYVDRELKIPAVQIEINKQFRVPAQNPQGFHRLLGALVGSIREIAQ